MCFPWGLHECTRPKTLLRLWFLLFGRSSCFKTRTYGKARASLALLNFSPTVSSHSNHLWDDGVSSPSVPSMLVSLVGSNHAKRLYTRSS
ncbi:uncharacterized protein EV420DRAFT_117433 [Desarmillaria tabescens]|uniref:Secreted protein n=1 Tax=Armillaria tabescens TaxID=1929756 RepID=A0AA39NRI9_ARMTA|nr:uncharacterized protein EV420DRAFT_117433 [Desarmillaria tabescens]KAK0470481.1 hypothetical protein EV420DRAFT_117433 [Desarmillaria tabescens]